MPIKTDIQTDTISQAQDGWSVPVTFQQLDPAGGTLLSVGLGLTGTITGIAAVENLGVTPATTPISIGGTIALNAGTVVVDRALPIAAGSVSLSAYDGILDFAGSSGTIATFTNSAPGTLTNATGSLSAFIGTGTVGWTATSLATLSETSNGNIFSVTRGEAGATVDLRYDSTGNPTGGSDGSSAASVFYNAPPPIPTAQWTPAQVLRAPESRSGWDDSLSLIQFDPSLGTLLAVSLTVLSDLNAGLAAENLGSSAGTVGLTEQSDLTLILPGSTAFTVGGATLSASANLQAFDGSVDFAGASGTLISTVANTGTYSTTIDRSLASYIGTGTTTIDVSNSTLAHLTGPADLAAELLTNAGAVLEVSYIYMPASTASAAATLAITGTQPNLTTPEQAPIRPFLGVQIADAPVGQTETVSIVLSDPANGALAIAVSNGLMADTRYNAATGVWTDIGTPSAVTADLQALAFVPDNMIASGTVATGFTISVTDTAGTTVTDTTTSVIETATGWIDKAAASAAVQTALASTSVPATPQVIQSQTTNAYELITPGSATGPFLSYQGSGVTTTTFAGWTPIATIQTSSGYDVAWRYTPTGQFTVWTTDANGNFTGEPNGVVSTDDPSFESIETAFANDLNGDGTVGLVGSPVGTASASASLAESGNIYMVQGAGSVGVDLKYDGSAVTASMFSGWTPLAAVQTAGGFDVAWKYAPTGQYTVWQTDAAGNFIAEPNGAVSPGDFSYETMETTFGLDLNNDGTIGLAGSTIATTASAALTTAANRFVITPPAGSPITLSYQGTAVTNATFPGWVPLAAVQTSSGFEVAWRYTPTGQFTVWMTDADGNFTGQPNGAVGSADASIQAAETSFGMDLTGDGTIGITGLTGSGPLRPDGGDYVLAPVGGTPVLLSYDGAAATSAMFPGWTPLAALQTSDGFEVAWKYAPTGQFTIWNTDTSGRFIAAPSGVVDGTALSYELAEKSFGVDLNGDGTIGVVGTLFSKFDTTTLLEADNTFVIIPANGDDIVLKYEGAPVTSSMFGDFLPVVAEQTDTGFDVVWEKRGSEQNITWVTDANGNYLSEPGGLVDNLSLTTQGTITLGPGLTDGSLTLGTINAGLLLMSRPVIASPPTGTDQITSLGVESGLTTAFTPAVVQPTSVVAENYSRSSPSGVVASTALNAPPMGFITASQPNLTVNPEVIPSVVSASNSDASVAPTLGPLITGTAVALSNYDTTLNLSAPSSVDGTASPSDRAPPLGAGHTIGDVLFNQLRLVDGPAFIQ